MSRGDADQLVDALLALRTMRARVEALERTAPEPIALVGIGCRFPGGASDPDGFWQLLRSGTDAIIPVPADRWVVDPRVAAAPADAPAVPAAGGFLEDVRSFDPHFFGITPREAIAMDPQQRLLLEIAWEALEDGGQVPARLAGTRTGVFIGIGLNDYGRLQVTDQDRDLRRIDTYSVSGNALCIAANRLSYLLDLRGPSMAIDTACSSSLVAVHMACQSLRTGESVVALAGGVNVMLSPSTGVGVARFLSPDARCKTFDARADGYVRGEGAGLVVLKPLSRAQADGDRIYAVIRGSAINQDGFSSGLTVPNGAAQEALLREALERAQVAPAAIQYVEAHGTGTALGDPIEVNALNAVLSAGRPAGRPCVIGSVKTNIGHLEAAAGVAGLIKVALSLDRRAIPASLHFETPNPHIAFDRMPLEVARAFASWPEADGPALAGVSSFGFGGTNAHVILEAAPPSPPKPAAPTEGSFILPLSARSRSSLERLTQAWDAFLASDGRDLADVCYTASVRRTHHPHRLAVVGRSAAELREQLRDALSGECAVGTAVGEVARTRPRLAFVFSGQGPQWWGMGRQLLASEPVFRAVVGECDRILRERGGSSILEDLGAHGASSRLERTDVAQPAIVALQAGLVALWRAWGVVPDAVVGHSVGEITAAHAAGALSLEQAMEIALHRGRLMHATAGRGRMAALEMDAARAAETLQGYDGRVTIAALNAPASVVMSGEAAALTEVTAELQARGIGCRMLPVDYAFHSPQMAPAARALAERLSALAPAAGEVPIFSTVTGGPIDPTTMNGAYWARNVEATVLFRSAIDILIEQGTTLFVEIGPHPVLGAAITQCLEGLDRPGLALASLRRGQDDRTALLGTFGTLYTRGVPVQWSGVVGPHRRAVRLPGYAWDRRPYWIRNAPPPGPPGPSAEPEGHPLLGAPIGSPMGAIFPARLGVDQLPLLGDHRIHAAAVLPAAAYLEMALTAARRATGCPRLRLADVSIIRPLVVPDATSLAIQLVLEPAGSEHRFRLFSSRTETPTAGDGWILHATGSIPGDPTTEAGTAEPLASVLDRCPAPSSSGALHYDGLRARGLRFGPRFRRIAEIRRGRDEAVGRVRVDAAPEEPTAEWAIDPTVLDACLQVLGAALPDESDELWLPVGFERVTIRGLLAGSTLWSHARLRPTDAALPETRAGDVTVFGESGALVLEVAGVTLKRATREALATIGLSEADPWLYAVRWRSESLTAPRLAPGGRWLVLGSAIGPADRLADALRARGERVEVDRAYRPASAEGPWRGVVHVAGSVIARADEADPTTPEAATAECAHLLEVAQALGRDPAGPPRLVVVTRGAQPVDGRVRAVASASLWGLAAVIASEQPALRCTCLDLDPVEDHAEVDRLCEELLADARSERVGWRGGVRHVARLVARPAPTPDEPNLDAPVQLEIAQRGVLEHLVCRPSRRRPPGPDEVEIQVEATGLNFRDVLNALGTLPGAIPALGSECAGVVAAVGAGVHGLAVGDPVVAITPSGAFRSYVTVPGALAAPRPDGLAPEDAAGLPVAFLTAQYALLHLAGLQPGERVLVHAAAGGVGLAAVQIAQRAGAHVLATAGSPAKRQILRALGVRDVMDSRSLGFRDEVLAHTGGRGVDVVLNSLAGDFIPASVRTLAPSGRFVEIGKTGIWSPEAVARLRPDVSYSVLDLGAVCTESPAEIQTMLLALMADVRAGHVQPLPRTVFALGDAPAAFRHMAQALHVGKIVLTQPPHGRPLVRGDATYLVTGGLGGLGLATARWLVANGARSLVLMGRRRPGDEASATLRALEEQGARVVTATGDIARDADVRRVLASIAESMPPLRGVVHASGVRDDGVLSEQTPGRLAAVMAPKLTGAGLLDQHTRECPLDFFVMFSSVAPLLGAPGQAGYAAANAALDAFAHHLRSEGRPATSINWGPWAGTGMWATLSPVDRLRWTEQGIRAIEPSDGLRMLEAILRRDLVQATALRIDWPHFRSRHEPPGLLVELVPPAATVPSAAPTLMDRLREAPAERARRLLNEHIREQILKVLGLDAGHRLDPGQGLREIGMDSLMAVELRNRLQTSLERALPSTTVFDHPTPGALCAHLTQLVLGSSQPASPGVFGAESDAVEPMSDAEAAAAFAQELTAMKATLARRKPADE